MSDESVNNVGGDLVTLKPLRRRGFLTLNCRLFQLISFGEVVLCFGFVADLLIIFYELIFSDMTLLYRYTLDCSIMSETLVGVTVVVSLYRTPLDAGSQQMVRSMIERGLLDRGFLVCLHSLFHRKFGSGICLLRQC